SRGPAKPDALERQSTLEKKQRDIILIGSRTRTYVSIDPSEGALRSLENAKAPARGAKRRSEKLRKKDEEADITGAEPRTGRKRLVGTLDCLKNVYGVVPGYMRMSTLQRGRKERMSSGKKYTASSKLAANSCAAGE
ncbi:hypothetical protein FOZ60_009799, partial [Perkinsus olseni]